MPRLFPASQGTSQDCARRGSVTSESPLPSRSHSCPDMSGPQMTGVGALSTLLGNCCPQTLGAQPGGRGAGRSGPGIQARCNRHVEQFLRGRSLPRARFPHPGLQIGADAVPLTVCALISWPSAACVCLGPASCDARAPGQADILSRPAAPATVVPLGSERAGVRLPGVARAGQSWVSLDFGGCSGGGVKAQSGKPGLPWGSELDQTPISLESGGLWPPCLAGDDGPGPVGPCSDSWSPMTGGPFGGSEALSLLPSAGPGAGRTPGILTQPGHHLGRGQSSHCPAVGLEGGGSRQGCGVMAA